jgi:hypothetical protein
MSRGRILAFLLLLFFLASWFLVPGGDALSIWLDRLRVFIAAAWSALAPLLPFPSLSVPSLAILIASSIAILPRAVYITWRTMRFWRRKRKLVHRVAASFA